MTDVDYDLAAIIMRRAMPYSSTMIILPTITSLFLVKFRFLLNMMVNYLLTAPHQPSLNNGLNNGNRTTQHKDNNEGHK